MPVSNGNWSLDASSLASGGGGGSRGACSRLDRSRSRCLARLRITSVGGDTPANTRDADGAIGGWPEHHCPGSPDRRRAGPSASGACVPAGTQRQNRISARGIEDGGERVCDRRHNVAFPYQAPLRLKSIRESWPEGLYQQITAHLCHVRPGFSGNLTHFVHLREQQTCRINELLEPVG